MMRKSSIYDHIIELKLRLWNILLVYAIIFAICYYFSEELYLFLTKPLDKIMHNSNKKIIYTGLAEAFFTYIKIAAFTAFITVTPLIAFHIYRFISPGLYKNEKVIAKAILICAPILFLIGSGCTFYIVVPKAFNFFLQFEIRDTSLPLILEARISEYLDLMITLIIAFGLASELPVVLILLHAMNIITTSFLLHKRRINILINFIIAGIITPPDIFSQIALAFTMILLYEISIIICRILDNRKNNVKY